MRLPRVVVLLFTLAALPHPAVTVTVIVTLPCTDGSVVISSVRSPGPAGAEGITLMLAFFTSL